jgi:hypothetical protein
LSSEGPAAFAKKVFYALEAELDDKEKVKLIKRLDTHTLQLALKILDIDVKEARSSEEIAAAFDPWMDRFEYKTNKYIRNILNQHKEIIEDHVVNNSTLLSEENKQLWYFLNILEIKNSWEIGDLMKLTSNEYHLALHRLIGSCMEIYKGTQNFTL